MPCTEKIYLKQGGSSLPDQEKENAAICQHGRRSGVNCDRRSRLKKYKLIREAVEDGG